MTSWTTERTDSTVTSGSRTVGSLTANDITSTSLTVDTTTLHVDADNDRVGIGTASPGYALHVSGAPTPQLVVTDTTNTVSSRIYADDNRGYVGTATNHDFAFQTNNTRRMSILAAGNVGIGTTAPRCLLEGKITARTTTFAAETASTWADITLWNPTDTINTATGIRFGVDSTDLDDGVDCGAGVAGIKEHATNEMVGLAFITDPSGGAVERMRIDNTGKVGIGTTTPDTTLEVVGSFAANGPSSTFVTFSDGDATPSVATGNIFKHHASTQTINMFDDGICGQIITVISTAAITYDFDASNLKCGSADIVTASGDVTMWVFDGTNWYLLSWMDVSANLADGSAGGF